MTLVTTFVELIANNLHPQCSADLQEAGFEIVQALAFSGAALLVSHTKQANKSAFFGERTSKTLYLSTKSSDMLFSSAYTSRKLIQPSPSLDFFFVERTLHWSLSNRFAYCRGRICLNSPNFRQFVHTSSLNLRFLGSAFCQSFQLFRRSAESLNFVFRLGEICSKLFNLSCSLSESFDMRSPFLVNSLVQLNLQHKEKVGLVFADRCEGRGV